MLLLIANVCWLFCCCLLTHVQPFATPWTIACQASLSLTISWSLPKFKLEKKNQTERKTRNFNNVHKGWQLSSFKLWFLLFCLKKSELIFWKASSTGQLHLGLHFMSFTPWKCLFKAVLSAHGEFKQESSSFSSSFWKHMGFAQEGIPVTCSTESTTNLPTPHLPREAGHLQTLNAGGHWAGPPPSCGVLGGISRKGLGWWNSRKAKGQLCYLQCWSSQEILLTHQPGRKEIQKRARVTVNKLMRRTSK